MKKRLVGLLLLLLFAVPCSAGIAIDATSHNVANSTGTTISVTHVVGGSQRLLVCALVTNHSYSSNSNSVSSFVWNTTENFTHINSVDEGDYTTVDMWRLVAPSTGSHSVAVTLSANTDVMSIGCISFTGVDQTTPTGTSSTCSNCFSNTITIPSSGIGIDAGGDSFAGCPNTWSVNGDSGQTKQFQDCADNGTGNTAPIFMSTNTTSGSVTFDWITAQAAPAAVAVPLNAAPTATAVHHKPIIFQ